MSLTAEHRGRQAPSIGGVAVFVVYPRKIGLVGRIREYLPVRWRSPNHIDPTATSTSFLISILLRAKRLAHATSCVETVPCKRCWD